MFFNVANSVVPVLSWGEQLTHLALYMSLKATVAAVYNTHKGVCLMAPTSSAWAVVIQSEHFN